MFKKNLKILLFCFSYFIVSCSNGITEEELSKMTEAAVEEALLELETQSKNQENDLNNITNKPSETKIENSQETTTTTVRETTTTTVRETTTTTVRETTTTTVPWALFGSFEYLCSTKTSYGYQCRTSSTASNSIYCSSIKENSDCSEYWYPNVLADYLLYDYNSQLLICEVEFLQEYSECKILPKRTNPNNISFYSPDYWCQESGLLSSTCYEYNPNEWVKIDDSDPGVYFCKSKNDGLDCYQSYSGKPPAGYISPTPDKYCNRDYGTYYDCSEYWYPNVLDDYLLTNDFYGTNLCKRATFDGYSYNDYNCGNYSGGDPSTVYFQRYKCTDRGWNVECNTDYYPSELDDYELVSIGYSGQYVCEKGFNQKCWKYYSGSLSDAAWGSPDYYCNSYGCSKDGWP